MSGFAAQALRAAILIGLLGAGVWALAATVVETAAVSGRSMVPALEPGDRVLVDRWTYRRRLPRPGEIVLLEDPAGGRRLIKRIARTLAAAGPGGPRRLWVLGDNPPESEDSRRFGAVEPRLVRGRVVWRYWPPSRVGSTGLSEPARYPSRSSATNL
jgi:nickel-type superoxide dismutase maturation protease